MRALMRLTAVAVVVLVGAGACAFERAGASTGASASPAPTATPTPSATPSPSPSVSPSRAPKPKPKSTPPKPKKPKPQGCPQGEQQREVEKSLAQLGDFGPVTVDGKQSAADCKAIKKFQQRYGISPAAGRAGPTTASVAKRLAGTKTSQCKAGSGTTICVNLTLQTVWVMRGGKVVMKPTVTRTGMSGFATPAGTYSIGWKAMREWSNPYKVWLPYWQQFNGGMGFHETTTYIHEGSIGSHGCINLLTEDAQRLWELGKVGTRVYLFGRRPGT